MYTIFPVLSKNSFTDVDVKGLLNFAHLIRFSLTGVFEVPHLVR